MLDLTAATLALRNRALSLVVCTTGATSLAATTTGYTRTSGSFVADGFVNGMEIQPAGFATNTPRVLTAVTALTLTTSSAPTAEVAASGRSLTVGIPSLRAFENVNLTPISGVPYFEEDFVPATNALVSFPAQGGLLEETGLYVLRWYGLSGVGISALRKSVDALRALFAPGTTMTANGVVVRVRGDTSSQTGQILPQAGGWSVLTLSIPWRAWSVNTVAA